MADPIHDLLNGPAAPAPPAEASPSLIDDLLAGAPEVRSADKPLSATKIGIVDDLTLAARALVIARVSLAPNVQDRIKRYAEHFGQSVAEFGVVNGEIVRWVPDKEVFAKVEPTIGGQTGIVNKAAAFAFAQAPAQLGPTLPSVVGGAVGAATGPTGASVPITAMAAGLPPWARRLLDHD